jgi:hypothetical protein
MAEKRYTTADLNKADNLATYYYKLAQSLRNATDPEKVKQYRQYLKSYQDAVKARDEIRVKIKTQKESDKNKDTVKKLQSELDIAIASGDTDKVADLAQKIVDAKGTPLDIDGKPLKGYKSSSGDKTELRYGPNGESLVPGTPAYESGSTVRPTVTTSKTSGTTGSTTSKPGGSGSGSKTPEADKIKTAWVGYLESTFKTLPKEYKAQIDKLFTTAKKENWTEATFTEALKQTTWWQQTLPSLRSFFIETHDPRNAATFAEKMGIQTANVAASLEKLGIRAQQVDPVTGKVIDNNVTIQGIAMDAIKNGWTDVQMLQHLGDNAQLLFTGGGTIGSSVDNIKKQALNYGITIDSNYLNTIQRSLLDPTDGRDTQYYLNEMKAQAMDLYKPFASSLKEGRSLYEVTNSYRNQMATLLEVDSTNLTWKDLMAKVVDPTTGNARTFADFNKQVKQDPLWQYTKNAKETYSNTALDLMKQFGFMG